MPLHTFNSVVCTHLRICKIFLLTRQNPTPFFSSPTSYTRNFSVLCLQYKLYFPLNFASYYTNRSNFPSSNPQPKHVNSCTNFQLKILKLRFNVIIWCADNKNITFIMKNTVNKTLCFRPETITIQICGKLPYRNYNKNKTHYLCVYMIWHYS